MPLVLPTWQTRLCTLNRPLLLNFYLSRRWTHIPRADTRILVLVNPRFLDAVVLPVVALPVHLVSAVALPVHLVSAVPLPVHLVSAVPLPVHLVSSVAAIHTQEPYALPRTSSVTGVVNMDTTGKSVAQVESTRWVMRALIQLQSPQMNGRKTVWKQFQCLLGH